MVNSNVKTRDEIPEEFKWHVASIFETDDAWSKEANAFAQEIFSIKSYQGRLNDTAKVVYEALYTQDQLAEKLGKIFTYAQLRNDEDKTNAGYQGMYDRAVKLFTQFQEATAFIQPELLSLDNERIARFLQEESRLKRYEQRFRELETLRPHVLNEAEETLLASAQEALGASSQAFSMLSDADLTFPDITSEKGEQVAVTQGRFISLLQDSNRNVRRQAFESVYGTYQTFANTFAAMLSGEVKQNSFQASVRNYDTTRQAALAANFIPENVYDQLVETVNEHLPLLHRYLRLRKRLLGLDELHMYDIYTPMIQGVGMPFTYEESQTVLLDALRPLGEEYVEIVQEGFAENWVDVYENVGKASGAYSSGEYGTKPFILMNWQDSLDGLSTLAHEFGHSVHSYYTRANQPNTYGDYTLFVAEVASTMNEALLHDHLMKRETDVRSKLYLLNDFLEGFRTTVFRQTMFAEFEAELYAKQEAGEALTADSISAAYLALNKKYYGEGVVSDELIQYEWARIPHFYMNYYVYQYATGYSAAAALAKQVLEEGEPAANRFIEFLKSGSSDFSITLLKKAGVDMETPEPVREAMGLFEATLDQMEELLAEQGD